MPSRLPSACSSSRPVRWWRSTGPTRSTPGGGSPSARSCSASASSRGRGLDAPTAIPIQRPPSRRTTSPPTLRPTISSSSPSSAWHGRAVKAGDGVRRTVPTAYRAAVLDATLAALRTAALDSTDAGGYFPAMYARVTRRVIDDAEAGTSSTTQRWRGSSSGSPTATSMRETSRRRRRNAGGGASTWPVIIRC